MTEALGILVEDFSLALYGSILVGMLCSFVGVYVVAKRIVFLGAVMTQLSVLGLSITFLPPIAVPHTVGSLVLTILSVAALSGVLGRGKLPRDAILGVVFVFAIALRILVLQNAAKVEAAEIDSLLRGDILFVTPELFFLLFGVFVLSLSLLIIFRKEFLFVTFDSETASTQGFSVRRWELGLYLIAASAISVATHMVGDVFVFGFLVIPPATGLLVAGRVRTVFLVSILIGAATPVIGLLAAFVFDVPASPSIVSAAMVPLLLVWLWRTIRSS